MSSITIEPFRTDMRREASRTLARAFVTNPLHVAAFGPGQLARNEAFFHTGISVMKGAKFAALDGSRILGFVHWVPSSECQLSAAEKLRLVPAMVRHFGLRPAWRVSAWLSAWSTHDPKEPHSHLGPIGVDPRAQRRHVGRRLMEEYCHHLDLLGQGGYLETDRPENVDFYRRFGFEVTLEASVVGVRNYFMWRRPNGPRLA